MTRAICLDVEPCSWSRPDLRHGMWVHTTEGIIVPIFITTPEGGCTNKCAVEGMLFIRDTTTWPVLLTTLVWPKPKWDWEQSSPRRGRAGTRIPITLNRHTLPLVQRGVAPQERRAVVLD